MGQKINPTGLRVGIIRDWDANGTLKKTLHQTFTKICTSANTLKRS